MRNGSPTYWQLRMRSPNTLERGGLSDGLVFDAVRVRLIEIGGSGQGDRSGGARLGARCALAGRRRDAQPSRAPLLRHRPRDRRCHRRTRPPAARRSSASVARSHRRLNLIGPDERPRTLAKEQRFLLADQRSLLSRLLSNDDESGGDMGCEYHLAGRLMSARVGAGDPA
jgi:hypothetical protein